VSHEGFVSGALVAVLWLVSDLASDSRTRRIASVIVRVASLALTVFS
jgi:hypothetical protein